jgi:hypothetical protein
MSPSTRRPSGEQSYHRLFWWWFAFGFPAFGAVVAIFWLMIAKPDVDFVRAFGSHGSLVIVKADYTKPEAHTTLT